MITEAFKTVLALSFIGSMVALFIVILKPITEKYAGFKFQYYVWLCVLISMTSFIYPKFVFYKTPVIAVSDRFENIRIIAQQTKQITAAEAEIAGKSISIIQFLAGIWVVGVIFFAASLLIRYFLFKRGLLNNSVTYNNEACKYVPMNLRTTDVLKTPVLIGVFKPVLYIPAEITDKQVINDIILHEMVHYKRKDLVYKWYTTLTRCIHWFNPFIYLAAKQIDYACEISCDIEAVKAMNVSEKKEYMRSILTVFEKMINSPSIFTVGMVNKKSLLEKRFRAIQQNKKKRWFFVACGVMAVFVVESIAVFAVNSAVNLKPLTEIKKTAFEPIAVPAPKTVRVLEDEKENKPILLPHIEDKQEEKAVLPVKEEAVTEVTGKVETAENVSFEDVESSLKKEGKQYIKTEFNYEGGDTRIIKGVMPDSNGCISVAVSSNANEVIEVSFADGETGRILNGARSFPVNKSGVCVIEDLDRTMKYDVIVKGSLRNNWEIESEIIIY